MGIFLVSLGMVLIFTRRRLLWSGVVAILTIVYVFRIYLTDPFDLDILNYDIQWQRATNADIKIGRR